MRTIDIGTWPRREHFRVFSTFDHPHFNMCANADLTTFDQYLRKRDFSFTIAIVYVLARAANAIPEFRYRIRSGGVVEHEVVHPSTTILADEDLFGFCTMEYVEEFALFAANAAERINAAKLHPTLEDEAGRDDLLFMTAIPWVSFSSFMHPMQLHPADSIPRFAWGKFFEDGNYLRMPLSVQAHHALMDGIHMGKFYAEVQGYLDQPEVVLGGV